MPPGARVMAHFASANRDDARVRGPADVRSRSRRTSGRHIAFGKGIHFCIGAPLARLELGIALPALLTRLPGLRAGGDAGDARAGLLRARLPQLARGLGSGIDARSSSSPARPAASAASTAARSREAGYARRRGRPRATRRRGGRRARRQRRLGVEVDVSDRGSTEAMAAAALERFGRIDALVNNAAYYTAIVKQEFEELTRRGVGLAASRSTCAARGSAAARWRRR